METRSILFVCLGNICRSPLAEGVMKKLAEERGLSERIYIESCGTGSWHVGNPPHEGTLRIAKKMGISLAGKCARTLTADDFRRFDVIVALDRENLRDVRARSKGSAAKICCLREYDSERGDLDVPDPYYTGDFETVYEIVHRCCESLLNDLT